MAQGDKSEFNLYVGFEPRFLTESWYTDSEFDVSIAPFVFEQSLGEKMGARIKSSVFYHVGSDSLNGLSIIGGGIGIFYYLNEKSEDHQYQGFFFGPWLEQTWNEIERMRHTTVAAEVGHAFNLKRRWTLNLSAQGGASSFSRTDRPSEGHFGIYFNIGYWIF